MRNKLVVSGVMLSAVAACGVESTTDSVATEVQSGAGVEPVIVDGNPTCADLGLGSFYDKKIDPPIPGTYSLDGHFNVTWSSNGSNKVVNWSSQLPVDVVIVKGGSAANVYHYDPEATSDTGLYAPDNASGGPAGLSHIDFCFDYELMVKKTATTSLTRTFSWAIEKTSALTELLLSVGQQYLMGYQVTVSATSADSDWATAGTITVKNPAPVAATVTGVTDSLAGVGDLPVDCGVTFPYTLAPQASLTCTYATDLADATTRLNTATATTAAGSAVGSGSGTASVDFAGATVNAVDNCVDVTDTLAGSLGTVCSDAAPKTFNYSLYIGGFASCGPQQVDNTAAFTAPSGATGSDTATVVVDVPCEGGCSLTQGYWKTHSSHGPAPYDDTWGGLEDTTFFLSGQTYYQVLWTPPQGNAYYNLAHQYIAAKMNGLNGANTAVIKQALLDAEALLSTYTPAQVLGFKKNSAARAQFISLGGTLGSYNEGAIGPGHCSE